MTAMVMLGQRVYGLGLLLLGILGMVSGDFLPGQQVPKNFPARAEFAYVAAGCIIIAATAIQWRRTAGAGAVALAAYYGLVVVLLMNGRVVLAHPSEFGAYSGAAEQLAIAAGGLIIYASNVEPGTIMALRLVRVGRMLFGVCAVLFGIAHFVYMDLTAPLVPTWLPPSQDFWAIVTGAAQIAAGIAIVIGWHVRLVAALLTAMYACFAVLVHAPMLVGDPANRYTWSENALNLALLGVAWVVADRRSVQAA